MGYNLLINGISWGYNPLSNLLVTSWDIQVVRLHPKSPNSKWGMRYASKEGQHAAISFLEKKANDPWWQNDLTTPHVLT